MEEESGVHRALKDSIAGPRRHRRPAREPADCVQSADALRARSFEAKASQDDAVAIDTSVVDAVFDAVVVDPQ